MKLLAILATSLTLVACGSTRHEIMVYNDLNHYIPNCNQPVQQMAFLKQQLRNAQDQQTKAVVMVSINYINRWCPESQLVREQGCIYARESFDRGSSNATVCRSAASRNPVVNRWETEVDN